MEVIVDGGFWHTQSKIVNKILVFNISSEMHKGTIFKVLVLNSSGLEAQDLASGRK